MDHLRPGVQNQLGQHGKTLSLLKIQKKFTRSRNRDHPGQQGETPSLLKIQKLAGHGGVSL